MPFLRRHEGLFAVFGFEAHSSSLFQLSRHHRFRIHVHDDPVAVASSLEEGMVRGDQDQEAT
jgi:hypothetical protein